MGRFESGTASNIIAEKAHLTGTTWSLDASVRQHFPELIETVVDGICRSQGATYRFDHKWGYPVLENDPAFTAYFRAAAEDILGPQRVITIDEPTMGGEDMDSSCSEYRERSSRWAAAGKRTGPRTRIIAPGLTLMKK
ncbi:MAG: hypothetical protein ACOZCF_03140 [Bacillota bacterium]